MKLKLVVPAATKSKPQRNPHRNEIHTTANPCRSEIHTTTKYHSEIHTTAKSTPQRNTTTKYHNEIPQRNPTTKSHNEIPQRNPTTKSHNEIHTTTKYHNEIHTTTKSSPASRHKTQASINPLPEATPPLAPNLSVHALSAIYCLFDTRYSRYRVYLLIDSI